MKILPTYLTALVLASGGASSAVALTQQTSPGKAGQVGQVDGSKSKATKPAIPCPLSADQQKAIQLIQAKNKIKLAPTALKLAGTVTQVYNNLLDDNMD